MNAFSIDLMLPTGCLCSSDSRRNHSNSMALKRVGIDKWKEEK
jgi:hypothetical protein